MAFLTKKKDLELGDYDIIPRPDELIKSQLKSSQSKESGDKKKKLKGKYVFCLSSKHEDRSSSKERSSTKERLPRTKSKTKISSKMSKRLQNSLNDQDLDKSFELHLKAAKKITSKYRYIVDSPKSMMNSQKKIGSLSSKQLSEELSSEEQKLLKKMDKPAFTDTERFNVLNAQDSYIRLKLAIRGESKHMKISGTCPDMCPEKERYSRITKNCLSVYEVKKAFDSATTSKVAEHCYMVKEYSRSSADQQEPLPHELRPVSVLLFTMDYLICNVINRQEDNFSTADWYDFIWNRTRSIRKDITQQQLCDVQCVEILEKCARFHILCAEALSEEGTATFDPKINNENLTKCLQTLKHMYHDLQTKGIQCPNEAEFRAYDILLSLTEGETLRLVKDIRKDIFKTSLVKSAFGAAFAFKSNNYIKFFKLMEKATYLSSCIMHRYIHEARVHAMQLIIRGYCVQNHPTLLPLSTLVKDLKFESISEAEHFCSWHGLKNEGTNVIIQRQVFQKPSTGYPITRATSLVGKKMQSNFGMIVNNGPLPENPLNWYQPRNSFSQSGILQDIFQRTDSYCSGINDIVTGPESKNESKDFDEKMDFESASLLPSQPSLCTWATQEDLRSLPETTAKDNTTINSSEFKLKTFENYQGGFNNAFNLNAQESKPDLPYFGLKDALKEETSLQSSFFSKSTEPEIIKPFWLNKSSFCEVKNTPELSQNSIVLDRRCLQFAGFQSNRPEGPLSFQFASKSNSFSNFFKRQWDTSENKSSNFKSIMHSAVESPKHEVAYSKIAFLDSSQQSLKHPDCELGSKNTCFESVKTPSETDGHKEHEQEFEKYSKDKETDDNDSLCVSDDIVATLNEGELSSVQSDNNISPIPATTDEDDTVLSLERKDEETLTNLREVKRNEVIQFVMDEVLSCCVEEMLWRICEEVVKKEWEVKTQLQNTLEQWRKDLTKRAINKWRLFCERKKQRDMYSKSKPLSPWVPMLINTQYVTSGASSPFTVYKKHCLVSRLADTKQRNLKPGWEPLNDSSFDFLRDCPVFPPAYLKSTGITKYFKIGLLLTETGDDNVFLFNEWIFKKFKLSRNPNDKDGGTSSLFVLNSGKTVVCIQAIVMGPSVISSFGDALKGMTALILCSPISFPDIKEFRSFLNQLGTMIGNSSLLLPFPLFVFLLPMEEKVDIVKELSTVLDDQYYSAKVFSTIKMDQFLELSSYSSNSNQLSSALKWLFQNQVPLPQLLTCSLQNYLEDSFASVFNILFWKLSLSEFKPLLQMPHHIITFYNKGLKARAALLNSEDLKLVSKCWPPQKLTVLQPNYKFIDIWLQTKAEELLKSLCLPPFVGDPHSIKDMWQYIIQIVENKRTDNAMLFISVQNVLQNTNNIDWPTIISKSAYHLLCCQCYQLSDYLESPVYYLKEDLDMISFDSYWKNLQLLIKEKEVKSRNRKICATRHVSPEKTKKRVIQDELYGRELENCDTVNISDIPNAVSCHMDNILSCLKFSLKKQNEESDELMLKLNESISGKRLCTDISHEEGNVFGPELSQTDDFLLTPKKMTNSLNNSNENSLLKEATALKPKTWEKFLNRSISPKVSSQKTIAEKLAELRYNIEKNNMLEDNMSLLLNL